MQTTALQPGFFHTGFIGLFAGVITAFFTFDLAVYLLTATAFFFMFRKARVPLPWLAYVPVAQLYPFFKTIKVSQWNWLWLAAPVFGSLAILALHAFGIVLCIFGCIVYAVVGIRWLIRLLQAYGINPLWLLGLLGLLIPFLSYLVSIGLVVLYCIMGFSASIQYNPNFDRRDGSGGDPFHFS
ncbi:hypothetical protein [Alicyclobacillus dauci]|uniref:Uncharacterized protein n=1 Tax=Alicyclobacillus dauci TaxID=1475485 RepID=A0ABY6Z119_9BACL|nr:hypothetical protein [Alicyclobacillus dauci]WAH36228.1 hypothetical protein NZD86_18595 [Alicyclobacillus dauci]